MSDIPLPCALFSLACLYVVTGYIGKALDRMEWMRHMRRSDRP